MFLEMLILLSWYVNIFLFSKVFLFMKMSYIFEIWPFSIIYFIWCTARYMMRQTPAPPNITRSTLLEGAQHSPELVFRSMDFCVPENQIFSALTYSTDLSTCLITLVFYMLSNYFLSFSCKPIGFSIGGALSFSLIWCSGSFCSKPVNNSGYISTITSLNFFPEFPAILAIFFIISDSSPSFDGAFYLLFHHVASVIWILLITGWFSVTCKFEDLKLFCGQSSITLTALQCHKIHISQWSFL